MCVFVCVGVCMYLDKKIQNSYKTIAALCATKRHGYHEEVQMEFLKNPVYFLFSLSHLYARYVLGKLLEKLESQTQGTLQTATSIPIFLSQWSSNKFSKFHFEKGTYKNYVSISSATMLTANLPINSLGLIINRCMNIKSLK